MSDRFAGKTVLVTGAAGALGQTIAGEVRNNSLFVALDVADEASWAAAVATIEERAGPISVLINNAAMIALGGIEDVKLDEWRRVIDTNLTGDLLGIRAVAPSMRKLGGGSIVMVSSIAGLHPTPGLVAYGCSKWALRGLVRTAASELAKDNIRVNALHPGIIETQLAYDKDGRPLVPVDKFAIPRNATTDEIARYVLFIASEDALFRRHQSSSQTAATHLDLSAGDSATARLVAGRLAGFEGNMSFQSGGKTEKMRLRAARPLDWAACGLLAMSLRRPFSQTTQEVTTCLRDRMSFV
ncbi:SDR family NAD(P)-dependent oxidoreductase [Mesorhizobium sp. CO1-1-8]|uniref:SDR family NAD(P)-dependent oxidoreductase n=1 Tax=Mesorhizobium sp. CO1-1-8 TaxID=2876631 RepID=UPI001CD155C7|nr:SDR family NAD(P)-dependent oxidoreductase [Mesorhizobium sp. CO1-1-8]MBZ9772401.1 SDR family oxidoreductase [Mesorhizobium sp. CO1-1-8]